MVKFLKLPISISPLYKGDKTIDAVMADRDPRLSEAANSQHPIRRVTWPTALAGALFGLRNILFFLVSLVAIGCFAFVVPANKVPALAAVEWTPRFAGALAWSVFGLSIGAIFLLFALIRRSDATRVTSLLYLTPPTTALMAWLMFGEAFSALGVASPFGGIAGTIFVAFIGAVVLLFLLRLLRGATVRRR